MSTAPRVLINHVKRATCAVFGLTVEDLTQQCREKRYVVPRQMAIAVARLLTGQSLPQLASAFERELSTIHHAIKASGDRIARDAREFETFHEIARLSRCYAAGDYSAPAAFSRSIDLDFVPDAEIRRLHDRHATPLAIATKLDLPLREVSRVLEAA